MDRAASRRTATRVTPGAICLRQFQPFPAQAVFIRHESGGVAARPRQAIDEAGADWIGDETVVTCGSSFAGPRAMPTAIADTGRLALRGQDFAVKDGLGVARPYQKAGLSNTRMCGGSEARLHAS